MNPEIAAAWSALNTLAAAPGARAIRARFAAEPNRPAAFTRRAGPLTLDLSRTSLGAESLAALQRLAAATGVLAARDAMARGEPVNTTEGRAALHMALRQTPGVGTPEATAEVTQTLAAMRAFTLAIHSGQTRGATEEPFTDILNIGIGGSDLGPAMAYRALARESSPLRAHYLANVDAHAWEALRPTLNPATTLILIASKTFTTQETMANAALARAWLTESLGAPALPHHLAALSTNLPATQAFGIPPERVFGFREWVGGRFSLWSAIGLSLPLALGWNAFEALLAGARGMDTHFLTAPAEDNLPLLLALTEIWHRNALGYAARAVLPYDERLARLPAHLQQLEMESLGKSTCLDGTPTPHATGPLVFGEPGTNAQHSFLQLLHQGTTPIPAEFLLVAHPDHPHADSHRKLLANGLAQAEALLLGRDAAAIAAEMRAQGVPEARIAALTPHRLFPGDRPSVTLLLPRLTPETLGALIALYEHKVACLGALWGINPFDQWGVELGKQLAGPILSALETGTPAGHPATDALLAAIAAAPRA